MQPLKQRSAISSLKVYNWKTYNLENIISGKTADGVSLLKLFLKDYMSLFNVKTVNPQCNSCLRTYLNDYKLKLNDMSNDCNYRLKTKYNGLPLEVSGKNSAISVTNANLTDEYARTLLKRYKSPADIFDKYPTKVECEDTCEKTIPQTKTEEIKDEVLVTKKSRKTRKK